MRLWRFLISVEFCLVLLLLICIVMATGSFLLSGEYAVAINAIPLFIWIVEVPLGISWWLWLTLILLTLLSLNTVCCSSETLWSRRGAGQLYVLLAPQLIHAGFLFIVLAHLLSAAGSSLNQMEVYEGSLVRLPNGTQFGVADISVSVSPQGMPIGFSSQLATDLKNLNQRTTISPNHPWFSGSYGVYIKQAEGYPYKRALLEIHREPGAGMALAGAILFTVGNILLLVIRSKVRECDMPDMHA